jgi:hypothetical protein
MVNHIHTGNARVSACKIWIFELLITTYALPTVIVNEIRNRNHQPTKNIPTLYIIKLIRVNNSNVLLSLLMLCIRVVVQHNIFKE